ncbi:unnamed protein product [Blepharisma stoltei]|uniref:Uncharacterized protein n=1 Tax=Blepharisma stoltei TaxID=1481888 RepID=A0AAU9JQR0_9CILI|nr:unnamed protein product [Blepharisma stoltei]
MEDDHNLDELKLKAQSLESTKEKLMAAIQTTRQSIFNYQSWISQLEKQNEALEIELSKKKEEIKNKRRSLRGR